MNKTLTTNQMNVLNKTMASNKNRKDKNNPFIVMRVNHLVCNRKGEKIFEDFNMTVLNNEFTIIFGEHGTRKVDLMHLLLGKATDYIGGIYLNGLRMSQRHPDFDHIAWFVDNDKLNMNERVDKFIKETFLRTSTWKQRLNWRNDVYKHNILKIKLEAAGTPQKKLLELDKFFHDQKNIEDETSRSFMVHRKARYHPTLRAEDEHAFIMNRRDYALNEINEESRNKILTLKSEVAFIKQTEKDKNIMEDKLSLIKDNISSAIANNNNDILNTGRKYELLIDTAKVKLNDEISNVRNNYNLKHDYKLAKKQLKQVQKWALNKYQYYLDTLIDNYDINPKTLILNEKQKDSINDNLKNITSSDDYMTEQINEISETFNVKNLLEKKFNSLSIQEKQRVQVMKALISKAPVVFLDRPFNGMDDEPKSKIIKWLKNEQIKYRMTIIVVTKSKQIAAKLSKDIINLNEIDQVIKKK